MKFLKITLSILLVISGFGLIGTASVVAYLYWISTSLPPVYSLTDYQYAVPTILYDTNGVKLAEIGDERRYPVSLSQMSSCMPDAIVAVEDERFYQHSGVDIRGILRAVWVDIKAGGRFVQGASTLTQQLTRYLYLSNDKKLMRKLKEMIIAYKIEQNLSKKQILEIYLNSIFFGHGSYGVEAASLQYFNKHASELTLSECALLAGLPQAPSRYAPTRNSTVAMLRRDHVLRRMLENSYINETQYNEATKEPIKIDVRYSPKNLHAEYFKNYLTKYIEQNFGDFNLSTIGFQIYTSLNLDNQIAAEDSVRGNLIEVSKRQGFYGPIGQFNLTEPPEGVDPKNLTQVRSYAEMLSDIPSYLKNVGFEKAVITNVSVKNAEFIILNETTIPKLIGHKINYTNNSTTEDLLIDDNRWAYPKESKKYYYFTIYSMKNILAPSNVVYVRKNEFGKWELADEPRVEGALVSIRPDGHILAMVGGFDYYRSNYNRVTMAYRQPGSGIKPLIYSVAIEKGYQPSDTIDDSPIIEEDDDGKIWKPHNDAKFFFGITTLDEALAHSRNIVTIRLAGKVGLNSVRAKLKQYGLSQEQPNDLTISLGSGSASPMEMVFAYSTFPNLGVQYPQRPILRIEDYNGNIYYQDDDSYYTPKRVIDESTASIMLYMLQNVVQHGTASQLRVIPRQIAAKTGTTNDYKDAWLIGILPDIVTVTWVGGDDYTSTIGEFETGAKAALPAWLSYTKTILPTVEPKLFNMTDDIIYYKVDNLSNQISSSLQSNYRFSPFRISNESKTTLPSY